MLDELKALEPFRAEVRAWLAANLPADWQQKMLGAPEEEHVAFQKAWFRAMMAGGYGAPHWPKEWGGSGFSFAQQIVLYEEIARAGAPRLILYFIALHHVPGTLLEWGTQAQRERHLPAVLTGNEIWCQGFSEPNAGSDLASLRTRAERHGDVFVVNGQKTWSSNAHHADFCLLLARTDPAAAKTRGISYFIMDMKAPGVTLRPIKQMTGASHFNEIFLDDVEIPAENLIGPEHGGWAVAQSTLSSERGLSVLELTERMRVGFRMLLESAQAEGPAGGRLIDDDEIRRRLVDIYARMQALRLLVNELLTQAMRGTKQGTEPSIIKIYYSELLRDFTALGVTLGGVAGQYLQPVLMGGANETGYWMQDYLYSWAWTISGGSSEIQRNIVAERGLKLPREPQPAAAGQGG
ncbi:acyl-CoA dehydrogenase family protein [Sphingomonas sp. CGMCC 1.13654]|uniref:Acyl-CoA dehydrogenase family protein n=1 Tax=Sphingomonas chungangi TaxID=2683589 RepID=A0A838L4C0_9SPHN|nr:acyl-CoA dehydrogenase family protein [Sphingomonas chungangi]MBA2933750.1 acyl-CoA dehydrogenase family protein [Sphingomonas chungangi]MVW55081.1 acyl-CoA dehydrogenase [Sphingomonas chungangi]